MEKAKVRLLSLSFLFPYLKEYNELDRFHLMLNKKEANHI
jgi:hypothetical protein